MSHFVNTHLPSGKTSPVETKALAPYYRLTSLMRLPGKTGTGVYNEATLYCAGDTLRIGWTSPTVDSRLRRGDIVTVREGRARAPHPEVLPVLRIARVDQPVAAVNPFDLVPSSWLHDRALAQRAKNLWEQMERPLQHLVNAVLWDGARFYRYVTGPVSVAAYPAPPGGTFRRAVALAEEAVLLADGLPNVARGVLIAAALLHDVREDYHVADRELTRRFGPTITTSCILLDKNGKEHDAYFCGIADDAIASLAKGGDRIHNLQTMVGVFSREKQLKAGSRATKLALIEAMNPAWQDLYPGLL